MAVLPETFQEPGVDGEIVGSGESAASGAENPTVMGAVPVTECWLEPGTTEVIGERGRRGHDVLWLALDWPGLLVRRGDRGGLQRGLARLGHQHADPGDRPRARPRSR